MNLTLPALILFTFLLSIICNQLASLNILILLIDSIFLILVPHKVTIYDHLPQVLISRNVFSIQSSIKTEPVITKFNFIYF